jgi:hypothetical protein
MSELARIGTFPVVPPPVPVEAGGARRSLSAGSGDPGTPTAFRRVDLPAPPVAPPPKGSEPRPDPRQAQAQPRAEDRPRGRPAPDRPDSPSARDAAVRQPPTGGQTRLLAGAAGVLAQLFGQDPGASGTVSDRQGGWRQGGQGGQGSASTTGSTDAGTAPGSLMTRLGVGAYQAVNRVIGAAAGRLSGADDDHGVLVLPDGGRVLDEVA